MRSKRGRAQPGVPGDRPVRRPQVPQEQRHLIVRQRENLCRNELLVTAEARNSPSLSSHAAIGFRFPWVNWYGAGRRNVVTRAAA